MNCENCKYCIFGEGNGNPSRYYCDHPQNPNLVNHISSGTLICKTKRHSTEMTRKRTPKWCPQKDTTEIPIESEGADNE